MHHSRIKAIWGLSGVATGFLLYAAIGGIGTASPASPASLFYESENGASYELLDEKVAILQADEFLNWQEQVQLFYRPLNVQVQEEIAKHADVNISYYFEDLETGAWTGTNERVGYIPASLAKIPTLAAVLKKLEITDTEGLDTKLTIQPEDFDPRSGIITKEQIGTEMTIGELARIYLGASDNSAGWTLKRMIDANDLIEARVAMGMPPLDTLGAEVSPKIYSNVLRSLYRSTYLPRPLSNFVLSVLSESIYTTGLPAGVPDDVGVAHKIGAFAEIGAYHDCGIVYHPKRHYILCVMTRKAQSPEEADRITSLLSKITHEYVSSGAAIPETTP